MFKCIEYLIFTSDERSLSLSPSDWKRLCDFNWFSIIIFFIINIKYLYNL